MNSGAPRRAPRDAAALREAVQRFLAACGQPALVDPGEPLLTLLPENHVLEVRRSRLVLEAWNESRILVRRIIDIGLERRGRMELEVERFGAKAGRLTLVDLAAPDGQRGLRDAARYGFREQFRRFLRREFAGWRAEVTSETDLEHSLSDVCARALVRKGRSGIAALGAPAGLTDTSHALTAGLLWLDHLRRREPRVVVERLALYVAETAVSATRQRVRLLDRRRVECVVYGYLADESAAAVDLHDAGNLDTVLEPLRGLPPAMSGIAAKLSSPPWVERVAQAGAVVSLRVRGLEFARIRGGEGCFGLAGKWKLDESTAEEAARLAAEVEKVRRPGGNRRHPLYAASPELWLESAVRADPRRLDGTLHARPLYGQVAAWAGGQRGVIDLLAADHEGRLAVIELKASEDLYLPMQALDYWMRVKWHHDRGELPARGYFPGLTLRKESPRLLLVSPALEFHPATETLLGFLSPEIDVESIGVGANWRERLQVVFRRKRLCADAAGGGNSR